MVSENGLNMTFRQKVFKMVSVGVVDDRVNRGYDIISIMLLLANLINAFIMTFDSVMANHRVLLNTVEEVTVGFFALDYVLRLYTAPCLYPDRSTGRAFLSYITSGAGIIDLLSFLPFYMPMFFPAGAAAFRLIRVARILRLFRINAYYDSMNVITDVIKGKSQQLLSSVFIIFVLMLASSLAMYSVEHEAQPTVFENALSGLWWAVSTLLTVGYGDIYPITRLGKLLGMVITFLGVGMVAIPTGIISAGFVEQYSRLQKLTDYAREQDLHFVKIQLTGEDSWCGRTLKELNFPQSFFVAMIERGKEIIVPRGNVKLRVGDRLVLAAEALKEERPLLLREITLGRTHEWNGTAIMDLDISRQTHIVMVRRNGGLLIPNGKLVLLEGDTVILYTKERAAKELALPAD